MSQLTVEHGLSRFYNGQHASPDESGWTLEVEGICYNLGKLSASGVL